MLLDGWLTNIELKTAPEKTRITFVFDRKFSKSYNSLRKLLIAKDKIAPFNTTQFTVLTTDPMLISAAQERLSTLVKLTVKCVGFQFTPADMPDTTVVGASLLLKSFIIRPTLH